MSWRKEQRRAERGYHHGNLKEALLQAALGLIAEKGAAGFTFADAARMAGVSPAAPYRHFRDRDELLSSIAQRGFEQFEAVLTQAWDDGRPDTVTAFERVGKAYLAFARKEPAFYSAMFESGLPVDLNPTLLAASERAFGIIRAAAERLAALAPPGTPRPPAMMMALHIWSMSHGVASLFARGDAARRKLPMSAEDLLEARGADLSARSRLPDRPPASRRKRTRPDQKPAGPPPVPPPHQVLGAPQNKFEGAACPRLDKNPGWFRYVNVIYIHNGVMPSWRGKWPTPQMSIDGAAPPKSPTARICLIRPGTPAGSP